jgi:outer membrane protein OmpA-like peptidoglycan-associated protein
MRFSRSILAIAAAAAFGISGVALAPAAIAQDVKSADVIVKGLASVKTRGFDPQAPEREAKQQELNAKLRAFKTRQITVEERTDVAKLIDESKYPNVDVQILFAFDSAEILPEARPALDELGKALSDPKLASGTFLIAGHTDAKGSDAYNLGLSQRRAESVKAFLVGTYHVDGNRLSVIGFGEEQLKNKDDPLADENRRVQIVNTGSATVAEGKPAPAPEPAAAPAPDATPPADAAPRPTQPLLLSRLTRQARRRRGSAA